MNQNLKISHSTPLLLNGAKSAEGKSSTVKPEPSEKAVEPTEAVIVKKPTPKPVKNIHSQIFKEFRRVLYTPTVYNKEEINMLMTDQQDMTNKGTREGTKEGTREGTAEDA